MGVSWESHGSLMGPKQKPWQVLSSAAHHTGHKGGQREWDNRATDAVGHQETFVEQWAHTT